MLSQARHALEENDKIDDAEESDDSDEIDDSNVIDKIDDSNVIDENDSFHTIMSQADQTEYVREDLSSKSKVKNWLVSSKNSKELPEKKQLAGRSNNHHNENQKENIPEVRNQFETNPFRAGLSANLQGPMNSQAQQRQEMFMNGMMKSFAREQDLHERDQDLYQRRLDVMRSMNKP